MRGISGFLVAAACVALPVGTALAPGTRQVRFEQRAVRRSLGIYGHEMYAVRGAERVKVPAAPYPGTHEMPNSDWIPYLYEPHPSPDGRWLFCTQTYAHGTTVSYLYRRVGTSLRYRLVVGPPAFEDRLVAWYCRRHRVPPAERRLMRTWRMVRFTEWTTGSQRLLVLFTSEPQVRGAQASALDVTYDPATGRFTAL